MIGDRVFEPDDLARRLEQLEASLSRLDQAALVAQLKELVPTYVPARNN